MTLHEAATGFTDSAVSPAASSAASFATETGASHQEPPSPSPRERGAYGNDLRMLECYLHCTALWRNAKAFRARFADSLQCRDLHRQYDTLMDRRRMDLRTSMDRWRKNVIDVGSWATALSRLQSFRIDFPEETAFLTEMQSQYDELYPKLP